MQLKSIFDKAVDRHIEGVIKADDEASLRLEIEEYVLTNEVAKRLERFLGAYNNYQGANGVWISGFFGSGKSHLLKMLALVLENRQIDGAAALDLFLPKCDDNEILRGDLKRAVAIPSKSILFNIDQKADVISKTQVDALLAVFVKVFDEMCGYYGKQGHIAQFERDLDSRGLYDDFKKAYAVAAGRPWEKGREQALLEGKNIASAYAQVTGGDDAAIGNILDKYRQEYRVSIEDFANQVNDYVNRQPPQFRLNFFVDEVGQYIADNIKLMTNLQTIAESLATKCRGRAWVIVTAQEDMDKVVGEMSRQQSNDFSKIQDRFANRLKLTSANVAEVIQKRLLIKNEGGIRLLTDIYHTEANNFKTLFDFGDGSQSYRNFKDRDHFIHGYPFIPYQFVLFQSAIQNLSLHNAFEGKHSSVGERSMLGVFQQVVIHIGGHDVGQLATLDLMFEGIRTSLKTNIQKAILQAEGQLDNALAIRLLKALFLVKYVKEFKSTVRNLCVLMTDDFGHDLPGQRKQIEEALSLLEQQSYVQRTGELYDYLTDEEKDVEQEIKSTEVESSDVADELEKLIFDHVLKSKKIRFDDNGQDYPFSRKLDDRLRGREHELAIHVVSPFHEHAGKNTLMSMQSMARDELLVMMPPDARLVSDLLMYKRTEKYIRQNITVTQQEAVKHILTDKGFRNRERYSEIQRSVQELLGKAGLYIAGTEQEVGGSDAQTRITRGFHELIIRVYPNLRMLRGMQYTEEQIKVILQNRQGTLEGVDIASLQEAEQEMLAIIQSNSRGGVRTSLKALIERFEKKPYGWSYAAILCILARLCVWGKVEVRVDSELIELDVLERTLRNTHGQGNVMLEPQIEFTGSQVRALKEFFQDFFDTPPRSSEAKALGKEAREAMDTLRQQLIPLAAQAEQYPFLTVLAPVLEQLREAATKPYTWYLTELPRQADELLDAKEAVIDPLRKFMAGPQKTIFDNARSFVQAQEANFPYLGQSAGPGLESGENSTDTPENLLAALTDPECFKGNRMQRVKTMLDTLGDKVGQRIAAEKALAEESLTSLRQRLCGMAEFSALSAEQQQQITRAFEERIRAIRQQPLIAVISDTTRRFEDEEYQRLLSQITTWAKPTPPPTPPTPPGKGTASRVKGDDPRPVPQDPSIEYVPIKTVRVAFDKAWLADESDVERYLASMREALLAEIRQGRRMQI